MSYLSMMEEKLPPGFRFHPRDEELVCDYLVRKLAGDFVNGGLYGCPIMIDVDLNKCEPWDLPEMACVGGKEWYFFSLRDRKYATGQRTNRATMSGYWKATGKDRPVARKGVLVGMRKTLVFYQGRAPKGRKTDWVMHEFRMEEHSAAATTNISKLSFKEDWVLCRVFFKSRGLPLPSKQGMGACCEDSGSSSLPPLMDNYITFDQTQMGLEGYEQVSCFSHPHPSSSASHMPRILERSTPPTSLSAIPDIASSLNPLSCDKKAMKAVLSHVTKLESAPKREDPQNVTGGSLYLSELELPHMWNPFGS